MPSQRHVFAVSDATGATCELLVKAALTQFTTAEVSLEKISDVRTDEQAREVVRRAAQVNGVVIFTMVSPTLRGTLQDEGRLCGVPTVDVLGPVLTRLSDVLEISPLAHPGLLRHLDTAYFNRIEAVDFALRHDDGLGLGSVADAEIVLVGVSRTSKSPTTVYLAYRGWRVANVPLVLGIEPPRELFEIDQRRIVALTITASVLHDVRHNRQAAMSGSPLGDYLKIARIKEELDFATRLYARTGWPVIDVTHKSIEETATEVMRTINARTGVRKGHIAEG